MKLIATWFALLIATSLATFAVAQGTLGQTSWRYFRVGNTGIQGDYCEALWVGPDGDPYIGGYDPGFEEGGFSKFLRFENRWVNYSNVDYPVIGHPDNQGVARAIDMVPDGVGKLWIGTWRGLLRFDLSAGLSRAASARPIIKYGPTNSGINDDRVYDIDRAPDGTMWFANNGSARFNPATNSWQRWDNMGSLYLAVQPKVGGGYLVWSAERYFGYVFRFDTATQAWTYWMPEAHGEVAGMPGKDCVDDSGNFWAFRMPSIPGEWNTLEYRRPDGVWVAPAPPYPSVSYNTSAFKAYGNCKALLADGNGTVWAFNGTTWSNLGIWRQGPNTGALDIDAAGWVWASGVGGAARRNPATGAWQRYRITNTANFDNFNNDLALDTSGNLYAGANAGGGVGGMVRFDGARWTGWNQLTYGYGYEWPFPNDNCHALTYRPSNGRVAVSPLNWLYGVHEWTGTGFAQLPPLTGAQSMVEDSLGRLWALGEYYSLSFHDGAWKSPVPIIGWGEKISKDPDRPGTVWAQTGHEVLRTDGIYSFSRTVDDFPALTPNSDVFTGMAVDRNGIVWIGCTINSSFGGLIRLDSNTGSFTMIRYDHGWVLPGLFAAPLAVSPDGRVWIVYTNTLGSFDGGLCWYDGTSSGAFPGPNGGVPQWGGLPHTQIRDMEVKPLADGYELWMSCLSRGIAVLKVKQL